jgi:hypothetical protein
MGRWTLLFVAVVASCHASDDTNWKDQQQSHVRIIGKRFRMLLIRSGQLYAINTQFGRGPIPTRYPDAIARELKRLSNEHPGCSFVGFTGNVSGQLSSDDSGDKRLEIRNIDAIHSLDAADIHIIRTKFRSEALKQEPIC